MNDLIYGRSPVESLTKLKKCKICKNRPADNRHAKDYNHKNIKAPGNCVRLCGLCHTAFHMINQKNSLDWEYMIQNKKQEIIKMADRLAKNRNSNF